MYQPDKSDMSVILGKDMTRVSQMCIAAVLCCRKKENDEISCGQLDLESVVFNLCT